MAEEAMYIDRGQLQAALKELDKLSNRFADNEWRRKVLGDSAELVADAAQKRQARNDSKEAHFYYRNQRRGKRRPRGTATNDRIKIKPGNLRKSIQYLSNLKRTPSAVIGPKRKKSLGSLKNLGRTPANSSGFYAQMSQRAYSGAEDFRRDIMDPALQQTASAVIGRMSREITQRTQKTTTQFRFWK